MGAGRLAVGCAYRLPPIALLSFPTVLTALTPLSPQAELRCCCVTPEHGISLALAEARAKQISELRYLVRFDLPAERSAPICADVTITFSLARVDGPVVLDFAPNSRGRIESCTVNGAPAKLEAVNGHLFLTPQHLRPGANTVRFECIAGDAPLNRRDDHLYTIFVPPRLEVWLVETGKRFVCASGNKDRVEMIVAAIQRGVACDGLEANRVDART